MCSFSQFFLDQANGSSGMSKSSATKKKTSSSKAGVSRTSTSTPSVRYLAIPRSSQPVVGTTRTPGVCWSLGSTMRCFLVGFSQVTRTWWNGCAMELRWSRMTGHGSMGHLRIMLFAIPLTWPISFLVHWVSDWEQ